MLLVPAGGLVRAGTNSTFWQELGKVALVPGSGGVFQVCVDGELVWDRKKGGFPDAKELKQKVRDHIAPNRSLGHADRP